MPPTFTTIPKYLQAGTKDLQSEAHMKVKSNIIRCSNSHYYDANIHVSSLLRSSIATRSGSGNVPLLTAFALWSNSLHQNPMTLIRPFLLLQNHYMSPTT